MMVFGIGVILLVVLVASGLVGWRAARRHFIQQYYKMEYGPATLTADQVGRLPVEYHLDNVPWIATEEPLCQSNSLQMVAAQQGIMQPRRCFDFLMGFTYGVSQIPGGLGFFPGTDPETGFVAAAPYLGLHRLYYTTDEASLYLDAVRSFISQGYAVRVALDMGILYGAGEGIPHSEILVGFGPGGFYYYETVCRAPAACKPGYRPAGDRGLYVSDERLLDAVGSQARTFEYPWRYSLTVFERGTLQEDLGPIWGRNGLSLMGGARFGPKQGADALDALAAEIEKRGTRLDAAEIRLGVETAAYVRKENATLLRESFPGEADLERAAALFDRTSGDFQAVLHALDGGISSGTEADHVASLLRDAATAEREIGKVFVARGQQPLADESAGRRNGSESPIDDSPPP